MAIRDRLSQSMTRGKRPGSDGDDMFDEEFLRRLELLQVTARRLIRGKQRAERKTKKVGSGLEFADHRQYSPGDDIRNVDWNVLSRLDQTLVRLYEEDEDLPLRLVVDVSQSMAARGGVKLRLAKRIAAALAYVGLAGLDRVGLSAISSEVHETLPALRGKGRIFRVLDFLRSVPQRRRDPRTCAPPVQAGGEPRVAQPGVTVVLSDFYDHPGRLRRTQRASLSQARGGLRAGASTPAEADPSGTEHVRGDVTMVDMREHGRKRDADPRPRACSRRFAKAHEKLLPASSKRKCRSPRHPLLSCDLRRRRLRKPPAAHLSPEGGVLR